LVTAALHATHLRGIIETRGEGTPEAPLQYQNSVEPVITAGSELEIRREWRQGWMVGGSYGFQRARYRRRPDTEEAGSRRIINAPEHLASLKGAVPIVPGVAQLAARAAIEGRRRISLASSAETRPAVIGDVVLTGDVQRYGLRWSLGIYNVLDWRYQVPITEGAPARTMVQNGRTLLLEVGLTL
jgi:outer membrane receptor for ferrienterochelin and colicins